MQKTYACRIHQDERYAECQQGEDQCTVFVTLQSLHIHLKRRQKHDIIKADPSEKFERGIARQDVKAILPHGYTGQHHAYNMWYAQLTHDDRCQQNNEQHHEKDERRVGNGEV